MDTPLPSGIQRRSPGGGIGAEPPEAKAFYSVADTLNFKANCKEIWKMKIVYKQFDVQNNIKCTKRIRLLFCLILYYTLITTPKMVRQLPNDVYSSAVTGFLR